MNPPLRGRIREYSRQRRAHDRVTKGWSVAGRVSSWVQRWERSAVGSLRRDARTARHTTGTHTLSSHLLALAAVVFDGHRSRQRDKNWAGRLLSET